MRKITLFVILFGLLAVEAVSDSSSCANMDIAVLSKGADVMCATSCKYQSCGTGHCEKRKGRATCICSSCAFGGGEWPNIPIPKRLKRSAERGSMEQQSVEWNDDMEQQSMKWDDKMKKQKMQPDSMEEYPFDKTISIEEDMD